MSIWDCPQWKGFLVLSIGAMVLWITQVRRDFKRSQVQPSAPYVELQNRTEQNRIVQLEGKYNYPLVHLHLTPVYHCLSLDGFYKCWTAQNNKQSNFAAVCMNLKLFQLNPQKFFWFISGEEKMETNVFQNLYPLSDDVSFVPKDYLLVPRSSEL